MKEFKSIARSYAALPFYVLGAVIIMLGSLILFISDTLAPDDIGKERALDIFFNRS